MLWSEVNEHVRGLQPIGMTPFNRLYAIDASRSTRVAPSNRDRRLKAHAPLLLCYSRAYHSIVDLYGLGILPVVSTGNTLLISGFGSLVDL